MIKTDLLQVSDQARDLDRGEGRLRQNLRLEAQEVQEVVDRPLLAVGVGVSVQREDVA